MKLTSADNAPDHFLLRMRSAVNNSLNVNLHQDQYRVLSHHLNLMQDRWDRLSSILMRAMEARWQQLDRSPTEIIDELDP
jgi:hypothetical protein